jgi:hypothetical protein
MFNTEGSVIIGRRAMGKVNEAGAGLEESLVETTDVLVKALRALGNAGHPDAASRLAAKAWWALRTTRPREAERVNGAMHYLARLPPEPGARPTQAPAPAPAPAPATKEIA